MDKKSFIMYTNYSECFDILSPEDCKTLLLAIFTYVETGKSTNLAGESKIAFLFIRQQIDRDTEKYIKISNKRAEAGRKGGKAKQANVNKCEQNEAYDEVQEPKLPTSRKGGKAKQANVNECEQNEAYDEVQEPKLPVDKIMHLYNETCKSLLKIDGIEGTRLKAVTARYLSYGSLEKFKDLFEKTECSNFLKGENERGWKADFDWIIKAENMRKVLENKYDNKNSPKACKNIKPNTLYYPQRNYTEEELNSLSENGDNLLECRKAY